MCMFDNCDGTVTMLSEAIPTARKAHKCRECGRAIESGEKYHVERFVFDGELTTHKTCAHCMVARCWLHDECGGYVFGGVEEDLREHAQDSYYAMDVKRLAVGMQWNWRTPTGRMLPVPQRPLTSLERRERAAA